MGDGPWSDFIKEDTDEEGKPTYNIPKVYSTAERWASFLITRYFLVAFVGKTTL